MTNAEVALMHSASARPLAPYTIAVPPALVPAFERAVEAAARKLGGPIADARRLVEVAVFQRGVAAVLKEFEE